MTVVLAYSKAEFDPETGWDSGTGAAQIAKATYQALVSHFPSQPIVYLGNTKHISGEIRDVDWLFSIEAHLSKLKKRLRPKNTVLISVNTPSWERFQWIAKAIKINKAACFGLDSSDNVFVTPVTKNKFDHIIHLGKLGPLSGEKYTQRLHLINLPLKSSHHRSTAENWSELTQILYFPGSLNFRKGLGLVTKIVEACPDIGNRLVIQGRATSWLAKHLLERLRKNGASIYEDYVNLESEIWKNRIRNTQFAVFPSFEEGQADTVLRLIEDGLLVLVSPHCGFTFKENELTVESNTPSDWIRAIERASNLDLETVKKYTLDQFRAASTVPPLRQQLDGALSAIVEAQSKTNSKTLDLEMPTLRALIGFLVAQLNRILRRLGL